MIIIVVCDLVGILGGRARAARRRPGPPGPARAAAPSRAAGGGGRRGLEDKAEAYFIESYR